MKYRYDPEIDVLTIELRKAKAVDERQIENIALHYDKTGEITAIEIMDASATALRLVDEMLRAQKGAIAGSIRSKQKKRK